MEKKYYCPICQSELEEISGCGAVSYFCNTCKKLISKKNIQTKEEMLDSSKKQPESGKSE